MSAAPYLFYLPSGLPRRTCSAAAPMPAADKDRYQWSHPEAAFVAPFFNLALYRCPHCGLTFHAPRTTEPVVRH